ncbi:MAG: Unknown protein [uncultured Sulfurovum sp.]|uniref:Lcl C-terminal domain-containing protein n=1 Tax=uncultured Sulfurovum sp. TaxID=269237 RepID=A0A6S6UE56_9BACT|nr:MAG: Unknown protein [uncultured Sulfurovum sp.]
MLGLSLALYADFSKSGNIVADSSTGLQWQDDAIGSSMTWTSAIMHCENLSLDGHNDWRLPNLNELTSLVNDGRINPSIDTTVFENTASSFYWSSTTYVGYTSSAWRVNFYSGNQGYDSKTNSSYVRCVRAGQP